MYSRDNKKIAKLIIDKRADLNIQDKVIFLYFLTNHNVDNINKYLFIFIFRMGLSLLRPILNYSR